MTDHQGLPDVQSLAALANEMFQALPNAESFVTELRSKVSHKTPSFSLPKNDAVPASGAPQPQAGFTPESYTAVKPAPDYSFNESSTNHPINDFQIDDLVAQVKLSEFGLPDESALKELLSSDRFVTRPQAPVNQGFPFTHPLETNAGNYHQVDAIGDRVTPDRTRLPGEQDVQQLLLAEFKLQKFDVPATSLSAVPSSHFYFLDSNTAPVFGNQPKNGQFAAESQGFDVQSIRRDFPILSERINDKPLVWFDNAATTHKPKSVIDRVSYFYEHENSNIHRAAHELAARATDAYEGARNKVARFIGAKSSDEIIFVRGATEAINLLANTFGKQQVGEGDEIIVSQLEHHANIVPWHILASRVGAKLRVIPVDDTGQILLDEFRKLINGRTKLVSVTQVSNALGTVTPIKDIINIAHASGVPVVVDGAQSVSHMRVNVQELDADFFVFSGHKVFGPTGIGVVYGKAEHLKNMSPWQGGGNMIADVTFEKIIYQDPPNRFEAGTGNIADAVGLGAAIDYVERIGMDRIARYEHDLLVYGTHRLQSIPGVRLVGTAANKASVLSFVLSGYKTEEVGTELNREGIAVRSGHHCAQPILRRFGLETTVRPSFAFYNTCDEIDLMVSVVERLTRQSK